MRRLLAVELRRFTKRPAIRWVALGVVAFAVLLSVVAFNVARPIDQEQIDRAQAEFENYHADWVANHEQWLADCLAEEARVQEEDPSADFGCEEGNAEPRIEDWVGEPPRFASTGVELVASTAGTSLLFVLLIAVTFVAAEFATGTMGTWLTFEPRRVRVYASKLGAAVMGVLPVVVVGFVVAVGGVLAAFAINGTLGELGASVWRELGGDVGRLLIAAALVAVIGVALAMLVRHTAAALGIAAGWLIVVEQIFAAWIPQIQGSSIGLNIMALTSGRASYYLDVCSVDELGRRTCEWTETVITGLQGGIVVGVVAAVLTALALWGFTRRDVP